MIAYNNSNMLRKLELPYHELVNLWEINSGVFSNTQEKRDFLFGISRKNRRDFTTRSCAEAKFFGKYPSVNNKHEILDPQKKLDNLIASIPEYIMDLSLKNKLKHSISLHNIGRYYDEKLRVYLKGYDDGTWFVRIPIKSNDVTNINYVGDPFPYIGEIIKIFKRDIYITLHVSNISVPPGRNSTAILTCISS